VARDYHRRKLRALCDRLIRGGRVGARDVEVVGLVPRFSAEVRRSRWQGRDIVEVRVRGPRQPTWGPWLTTETAARRLKEAGFVEAAIKRLGA
jgi:hypothetical protein